MRHGWIFFQSVLGAWAENSWKMRNLLSAKTIIEKFRHWSIIIPFWRWIFTPENTIYQRECAMPISIYLQGSGKIFCTQSGFCQGSLKREYLFDVLWPIELVLGANDFHSLLSVLTWNKACVFIYISSLSLFLSLFTMFSFQRNPCVPRSVLQCQSVSVRGHSVIDYGNLTPGHCSAPLSVILLGRRTTLNTWGLMCWALKKTRNICPRNEIFVHII